MYSVKISPLETLTKKEIDTFYEIVELAKNFTDFLNDRHCSRCYHEGPCEIKEYDEKSDGMIKTLNGILFSYKCRHFKETGSFPKSKNTISSGDVKVFCRVCKIFKDDQRENLSLYKNFFDFLEHKDEFVKRHKKDKKIKEMLEQPSLLGKLTIETWQKKKMNGFENATYFRPVIDGVFGGKGELKISTNGIKGSEFPWLVEISGNRVSKGHNKLGGLFCYRLEDLNKEKISLIDKWLQTVANYQ